MSLSLIIRPVHSPEFLRSVFLLPRLVQSLLRQGTLQPQSRKFSSGKNFLFSVPAVQKTPGRRHGGQRPLHPGRILSADPDGAAPWGTAHGKLTMAVGLHADMGPGNVGQLHPRQLFKLEGSGFGIPDGHDYHHRMFAQGNPAGFLGVLIKLIHNVITEQMSPQPDHLFQQADPGKVPGSGEIRFKHTGHSVAAQQNPGVG